MVAMSSIAVPPLAPLNNSGFWRAELGMPGTKWSANSEMRKDVRCSALSYHSRYMVAIE
jgi:hypothetical protein